jgi:hypothetical protein
MSNQYSRKDQIEEFMGSLLRAATFAEEVKGFAYPKELAQFIKPLQDILNTAGDIEFKYFQKQWAKEDDEAGQ